MLELLMPIFQKLEPKIKLETLNESSVQTALAPILRQMAIQHLREGQGIVARGFRAEYGYTATDDMNTFLDKQARNGVWGTYVELAALGELFGCDIVVTTIHKGIEQEPWCVHRASDEQDAKPLIHLYNRNNTHWFFSSDASTKGDGNCLYNAVAEALYAMLPKQPTATKSVVTVAVAPANTATFFKSPIEEIAKQQQKDIEDAIKRTLAIQKSPTPAEAHHAFEAEEKRLASLSPEELQQIREDHQLAIKLAMEEEVQTPCFGH